ncbi:hypothetical protein COHA_004437 [Chlorella ohadii]|uniref:EF-hand domain-containing protein n=1 Tax=Chlorella ohadii TaxID=2649997 RepID=A0AAD5H2M4_9CHLO|nr:hypothetical protein COHA_004437 [Chlorella ohadii]
MGRQCSALVLLVLLVAQQAAARMFDHTKPVKREVARRRNQQGRWTPKEVDSEQVGRAAFDPHYGLDDDLDPEDFGLRRNEVHDATPSVIEQRLRQLFPEIDANHDGVVSAEELQRHLYRNGMTMSHRRADMEFADVDSDHDGKVTAAEYLSAQLGGAPAATQEAVKAFRMPDPLDWGDYVAVSLAAMVLADQDGDGGLNQKEFFDYLNPEEGSNVALKLHRLKQDIYDHVASMHGGFVEDASQQDEARKLRLSFEQFQQSLWPQFSVWEPHNEDRSEAAETESARRKFVLLDVDSDNYLTAEELLPAFADIHPTESRYARMQAEHMMDMADCKDDRLTLEQMLAVPHAFYTVVHHDNHDNTEL